MNIWHTVGKDRIHPDNFVACIEISAGSKNKYELEKQTGTLILDRILYTSTHYPQNYGFIPLTYAEDLDPLDVLVLSSESIVPLALVECLPIGVLEMIDGGFLDEKIIAVCKNDPIFNIYKDIKDLPPHITNEICHFFRVYKQLENKKTIVNEMKGAKYAKEVIAKSLKAYEDKFVEYTPFDNR